MPRLNLIKDKKAFGRRWEPMKWISGPSGERGTGDGDGDEYVGGRDAAIWRHLLFVQPTTVYFPMCSPVMR
ncbi:hypothetical protein HYALB_00011201 [Hymenoscyphus albidus]|uniref:Uncharacterized protein n=1 Tax=Hymenoscyphus albidus TaxID=595503 RepID=A0A9N9LMC2_9HELO|nr:hypothetical protein HYALB_00011201 [Hymenoscyphus albidus]